MMEKKEFNKAEIEIIKFDKEDDIRTDMSSFTATAEDPKNQPGPNPPFPMPTN